MQRMISTEASYVVNKSFKVRHENYWAGRVQRNQKFLKNEAAFRKMFKTKRNTLDPNHGFLNREIHATP